jgi:hypothetical protein
MINETSQLTYESIRTVTTNPPVLVMLLIIWFLPIILYLIIASVTKAKSSSGRTFGRMIFTRGTAIVLGIWLLFQVLLFIIGLIFPVWIKMIG